MSYGHQPVTARSATLLLSILCSTVQTTTLGLSTRGSYGSATGLQRHIRQGQQSQLYLLLSCERRWESDTALHDVISAPCSSTPRTTGKEMKQSCKQDVVPTAGPSSMTLTFCATPAPSCLSLGRSLMLKPLVVKSYISLAMPSSSAFPVHHPSLKSCIEASVSSWKQLLAVRLLFAVSLYYCWRKNWPPQEAVL